MKSIPKETFLSTELDMILLLNTDLAVAPLSLASPGILAL